MFNFVSLKSSNHITTKRHLIKINNSSSPSAPHGNFRQRPLWRCNYWDIISTSHLAILGSIICFCLMKHWKAMLRLCSFLLRQVIKIFYEFQNGLYEFYVPKMTQDALLVQNEHMWYAHKMAMVLLFEFLKHANSSFM
jgi:hypothetical protein